jgi:hypothetical protein
MCVCVCVCVSMFVCNRRRLMIDKVCILLAQRLCGYTHCVTASVNSEAASTCTYFQI